MSKRIISAIDVGSSKVTTVIATVDDNDARPLVIGVYSHPSQGIKKGVIVNIDEATNSISESVTAAERMAGVTISDVYVTINGATITSINNRGVVAVAGNEITMDDTYRAIDNARTLTLPPNVNPIHILPREFVVDSQSGIKYPIGMSGQRLEVETHIITAPVSAVKNLRKCVEQLALNMYDLGFVGWASAKAVLTDTEKELGVGVLDIGAGTTSITVFEEGAVTYSGVVPIGGENITSDIAIGLQVGLEDAEKIKLNLDKIYEDQLQKIQEEKKKPALLRAKEEPKEDMDKDDMADIRSLGISSKEYISKSLLKKIIDARLEELFEMVREQIKAGGFEMNIPAGMVITGGTANLRGVTSLAQESFGVPSRVGNPSGLAGMIEEISDPAYSAVQGLVKHAMVDEGGMGTEGVGGSRLPDVKGIIGGVGKFFKKLLP